MQRLLSFLIGPELIWLIIYFATGIWIKASMPSKSFDNMLVNLAYIVPFLLVPLTFALYFVPFVEKRWLLLRIAVACLVGAHFVLEKGLGAHSEQGPGVGTAYIMGMVFTVVAIIAGSVVRAFLK